MCYALRHLLGTLRSSLHHMSKYKLVARQQIVFELTPPSVIRHCRLQHRLIVCFRGTADLMGDILLETNTGSRPAHAEEPPLAKSQCCVQK